MKHAQAGQAAIEYLLIAALVVLVLWSSPDNVIGQLLEAIRSRYLNFVQILYQP
jgi:hypothetical protein